MWEVLNYEEPPGEELAKQFDVQMPVVVLVRTEDGTAKAWKRLDKVWALVGDKAAFSDYIRDEINAMIEPENPQQEPPVADASSGVPAPEANEDKGAQPSRGVDIPIPQ